MRFKTVMSRILILLGKGKGMTVLEISKGFSGITSVRTILHGLQVLVGQGLVVFVGKRDCCGFGKVCKLFDKYELVKKSEKE